MEKKGNVFGVALLILGSGTKHQLYFFRERQPLYQGTPFVVAHTPPFVPSFRCFHNAEWYMKGEVSHTTAIVDAAEVPAWVASLPDS